VMAFGLKNALVFFQRVMDQVASNVSLRWNQWKIKELSMFLGS
jgi:hypothetical protein